MKKKEALAADYWINNTKRIYDENLHVSTPVMEAYIAGFEKARHLASNIVFNQMGVSHWTEEDTIELINNLGEDEEKRISRKNAPVKN